MSKGKLTYVMVFEDDNVDYDTFEAVDPRPGEPFTWEVGLQEFGRMLDTLTDWDTCTLTVIRGNDV